MAWFFPVPKQLLLSPLLPKEDTHQQVKVTIILGTQFILLAVLGLSILINLLAQQYNRALQIFVISLSYLPGFMLLKRYPVQRAALYFIIVSIANASLVAVLRIQQGVDFHVDNFFFFIVSITIFLLDGWLAFGMAILIGSIGLLCRGLAIYYLQQPNDIGQYLLFLAPFLLLIFVSDLIKKRTQENQRVIEAKNSQLSELNSLNNKLFNIIAHDLRSPAVSLKIQLQLLRQKSLSQDALTIPAADYHQLIDQVDTLYGTLDNLLHWSLLQRESMGRRPVWADLSELLQSTLNLYNNQLQLKKLTLQLDLQPAEVLVDEHQVQIIFRNLLQNAIKFTPMGESIRLQILPSQDGAQVTITDFGIGMDEATLATLTSSFQPRPGTTGEKGTGIGLRLVHELVAANQGTVRIESQVGKGTSVAVFFPNVEMQAAGHNGRS